MKTRRVIDYGFRAGPIAAVAVAALGGCNSVSQEDYSAAVTENEQLRERITTLQDSVRRAEADKDVLRDRNAELDGEVERLQQQLASAPSATVTAGGSGFSQRPTDVVVTVAGDVLFASGQATLTAAGRRELDQIARVILREYPNNLIRVEGHTDSDPIRKSKWVTNERLSAERALAVEAYLVERGIDPGQVYAAAMGSSRPKSSKRDSRRVEIVILSGT